MILEFWDQYTHHFLGHQPLRNPTPRRSRLTMYPYRTYLVRDLKRILRLRGLRVCGKKAELVARLEQNDEDQYVCSR